VTVDNLLFGEKPYSENGEFQELSGVLNGCDEIESDIIMDAVVGTAAALKLSLRKRSDV
jgi:hypothetical protein